MRSLITILCFSSQAFGWYLNATATYTEEDILALEKRQSEASETAPDAATNTGLRLSFPKAQGAAVKLAAPKRVGKGQKFDGKMALYDRSPSTCKKQKEGGEKETMFLLEDGATLSNVIIGPNQGEGVYCLGQCTLNNVWWQDVCEDAATFKQKSGNSYVNGGGAKGASDKVFQHNGGGTVHIKNFLAENDGKLYRSCGNCAPQYARHVRITNVRVKGTKVVAGVNGNMGDTAIISNSCVVGGNVCAAFKGVQKGQEPKQTGTANADAQSIGKVCQLKGVKRTC